MMNPKTLREKMSAELEQTSEVEHDLKNALIVECSSQRELDEMMNVSKMLEVLFVVPDEQKDHHLDDLIKNVMHRIKVDN